ncbi:Ig-like domain repeat protein [Streptomyces sp. NPDC052225]|uniref:Ig-like domain repeat protein n=1 Tax=Streptomyces sp. NPDC052225 TaxID=3154949 RepID=UPI00342E4795
MSKAQHIRRTAALLVAGVLGAAGLVTGTASQALAATPADTAVKLPVTNFSALAVDSAHQRVYVSEGDAEYPTNPAVHVYDFDGKKVATVAVPTFASGLGVSADGATLYVGQKGGILSFDTTTLEQTANVTANYDTCGRSLAVAGGRVWHTTKYEYQSGYCATGYTYLDRTSGSSPRTGWGDYGRIHLFGGGPAAPDRFYAAQELTSASTNPFVTAFSADSDDPVRGPERRFADADGKGALDFKDLAPSADGTKVAVADAAYGTRLLNADDLTTAAGQYQALPEGAKGSAVAFSGDGTYVARGASASGSTPDLLIQPADPADTTAPLEFAFEGSLDGDAVVPRGLAFAADGSRLFAVTHHGSYEYWLHVITPPARQYDARFTGGLTQSPSSAVVGEPVALRGKVEFDGGAPATPSKITAVRRDADGTTTELTPVKLAADGSFTVLDAPDRVGEATYTVSYLGDLTHRPAADVVRTVQVGKAPTTIALTAPTDATRSGGVEITGTFTAAGPSLPSAASLSVERTDRLGTQALPAVEVGADGTFTVRDLPRTTKSMTYKVSWPGDELHGASTASATVTVRR